MLFLVDDYQENQFKIGNYNNIKRLIACASKAGIKVFISSWNNIQIKGKSVFLKKGVIKTKKKENQIKKLTKLSPDYINLHISDSNEDIELYKGNTEIFNDLIEKGIIENNKISEPSLAIKYLEYLVKNHWKNAHLSYQHDILMTGKWYLEKYFKKGEENNLKVNRPSTYIEPKEQMLETIKQIFDEAKKQILIAKPHGETCSRGIELITEKNYKEKSKSIKASEEEFYVLQEFLTDTHLYENKKTDLRIYVGVFSWHPLKFKVYPYGLTRISNKPFNADDLEDEESAISTISLLNGKIEHNLTIQEYLETIPNTEKEIVWNRINEEVEKSLKSMLLGMNVEKNKLDKIIYLLGFDVILKDTFDPYIIEINHFPTIYRSKENDPEDKVNNLLDKSYLEFFDDIKSHLEPVIDISEICPSVITNEPILLRKTVANMLKKAEENLPEDYTFFIMEGLRSVEKQKEYFETYFTSFQNEHPDWDKEKILKTVEKFVHPHEGKWASGHLCGAAIDLVLMKNGEKVPLEDETLSFEENSMSNQPKLPQEIKNNRKIIFEALEKAGLVNNPNEYWHWSYGDIWWAKLAGKKDAKYGIINPDVHQEHQTSLHTRTS